MFSFTNKKKGTRIEDLKIQIQSAEEHLKRCLEEENLADEEYIEIAILRTNCARDYLSSLYKILKLESMKEGESYGCA